MYVSALVYIQDSLKSSGLDLSGKGLDDPVRFYIACVLLAILITFVAFNLSGKWKAEDDTQHKMWRLVSSILMAIVGTQFLDGVINLQTNFEYISVYAVGGPAFGLVNFFFWGNFRPRPIPGISLNIPEGISFDKTIKLINQSSNIRIQLQNFDQDDLDTRLPYPHLLIIDLSNTSEDIRAIRDHFPGIKEYQVDQMSDKLFKLS